MQIMIPGILIFSVVVFIVSYLVARARAIDSGKLSVSITLIAWASLIFGLFIARFSPLN